MKPWPVLLDHFIEGDKNRNKKEFIAGFLKSVVFGAFLASMDEFERHLICENCGHKTIQQ
ncbi:hypothetical protein [Vibrio parahaemolyticus]|uniref:hypothetical protein n=1 Tax=Vibrio parahaemolyticus TaxID=670 RepID=UPI0022B2FC51|nr:hypothetical protein [Vibrio parahaemolyticus]MCZ5986269.1 hypothetical protein [Vibrio parahaemolyticus]